MRSLGLAVLATLAVVSTVRADELSIEVDERCPFSSAAVREHLASEADPSERARLAPGVRLLCDPNRPRLVIGGKDIMLAAVPIDAWTAALTLIELAPSMVLANPRSEASASPVTADRPTVNRGTTEKAQTGPVWEVRIGPRLTLLGTHPQRGAAIEVVRYMRSPWALSASLELGVRSSPATSDAHGNVGSTAAPALSASLGGYRRLVVGPLRLGIGGHIGVDDERDPKLPMRGLAALDLDVAVPLGRRMRLGVQSLASVTRAWEPGTRTAIELGGYVGAVF